MERSHIDVRFAYEYGDKSLPKIKELVCEKPDSQKKIIPEYLREHCVICCPGTECVFKETVLLNTEICSKAMMTFCFG